MRAIQFVAAWLIVVILAAWLLMLFFSAPPDLRDIGKPCRDHGGVRQWVPSRQFDVPPADGIVVCLDGKIGEVP